MNLVLSQTITAMRVNERLMCRLLRWAAAHSQDPHRFIESAMEEARDDLRSAADDGSSVSAIAADEALEYLDSLASEIKTKHKRKDKKKAPQRGRVCVPVAQNHAPPPLFPGLLNDE